MELSKFYVIIYLLEKGGVELFPLLYICLGGVIVKEVVESLINSKIKDLGIYVSDAFRKKEEGKTIFNIELDSEDVIDLNKITEASRIINEIMDNTEEIEQDYDELDIYSKEKGDATNE